MRVRRVAIAASLAVAAVVPAVADVASKPAPGNDTKAARRRAQLSTPIAHAAAMLAAVQKAKRERPRREWQQIASADGLFEASFPAKPKQYAVAGDADSELGDAIDDELLVAPDEAYVIGSAKIRKLGSTERDAVQDALTGAAERLHGSITNVMRSSDGRTIQGRIALQSSATIELRIMVRDGVLYCLAAGDRTPDTLADTEKFFSSYAPISGEPPSALTGTGDSSSGFADDAAQLPSGVVEPRTPVLSGTLEAAVVTRYVKRNIEKLRYCYDRGLRTSPRLTGTVTVKLAIASNGSVTTSAASGVDPSVAKCFGDVIGNIAFPATTNGGAVRYPFRLHPSR